MILLRGLYLKDFAPPSLPHGFPLVFLLEFDRDDEPSFGSYLLFVYSFSEVSDAAEQPEWPRSHH